MAVAKPRCGGMWTEARFKSFIVSALRNSTRRWSPIQRCKQLGRTRRGFYRCALCKKEGPATLPPHKGKVRRINNAVVDHCEPIVDTKKGFQGYDEWVRRGFVELDGLQLLCHSCHTKKSAQEREERKLNKQQ